MDRSKKQRLVRSQSLQASTFLERRGGIYKEGTIKIKESGALSVIRTRFVSLLFQLSAVRLRGIGETDGNTKIDIDLRNIQTLEWQKEDNESKYWSFKIGFTTEEDESKEIIVITDSKEDMGLWMLCLDGLVSNLLSNSFNSFFHPLTDKKHLLQLLYKDNYKGGIVKSSDEEEEWQYSADGTLCLLSSTDKLEYIWDGEILQPKSSDVPSFGAGQWNGVWLGWYQKEWMTFNTGKREKFLKYFFDHNEKTFFPEHGHLSSWKFSRHFLVASSQENSWIVEGQAFINLSWCLFTSAEGNHATHFYPNCVKEFRQHNKPKNQHSTLVVSIITSALVAGLCIFLYEYFARSKKQL